MKPLTAAVESLVTELLHGAFAPLGKTCVITKLSSEAPYPQNPQWQTVRFAGIDNFTIALAYETDGSRDLIALTSHLEQAMGDFTVLLSNALKLTIEGVDVEAASAPPVDLTFRWNVQGIEDGLVLTIGLDPDSVQWMAEHGPLPRPTGDTPLMDSLLDVELPVSIRLASRLAPLDEVLTWGPGSIVAFEANLDDPVEVVVNRKTVAKGAVVLVNGNYGVRVTEVLPCT